MVPLLTVERWISTYSLQKKTGHYAPKCRQPPIVDSLEWHLVVVPRKITILALVRRRNYDISLALTKFGFFFVGLSGQTQSFRSSEQH